MTTEQAGGREHARVVVDVSGYRHPDLALVDVLTRLRLVTRRLGAELLVLGAGEDLGRLLDLLGLLGVVPVASAGDSEFGGEAEPREQPGVEEVVDVSDAPVPQLEHLDGPRRQPPAGTGFVLGEGG